MQIRLSLATFLVPAAAGVLLTASACPLIGDDDDDSAGDDDDSAGDDDDDDDDSAGDDDDSPPYALELLDLNISCEGRGDERGQEGTWNVSAHFDGWVDIDAGDFSPRAWLWVWDEFESAGEHYIDPHQPFTGYNGNYEDAQDNPSDEESDFDVMSWELNSWDSIGEAAASTVTDPDDVDHDNGTIMDCFDGNDVENNHNFMVCAYDYQDPDALEPLCWFCGDGFGGSAFGTDDPVGSGVDPEGTDVGGNSAVELDEDVTCFRTHVFTGR